MTAAIAKQTQPKTAVSMRQCRLALLQSGLLTTVNAALAALPGEVGENARIEWEYATEVERDWPLVLQLATALGLSESQIDDLFTLARSL